MPDAPTLVKALLLAAGRGSRFDPSGRTSKLLAEIDGTPVAVHALRRLLDAGLPVTAVVRAPGRLADALTHAGAQVLVFAGAQEGMGASLAHGIGQLCHGEDPPDAILVALADMPSISAKTIRALIGRIGERTPIVAPCHQGRRGHPVLFWRSQFDALSQLSGDRGAAALLRQDKPVLVEVDDPAILIDIDEPGDLPTG
ncbi:MAG: nucleotidyltransferase family protein [Burkholderiaceae bacterium]